MSASSKPPDNAHTPESGESRSVSANDKPAADAPAAAKPVADEPAAEAPATDSTVATLDAPAAQPSEPASAEYVAVEASPDFEKLRRTLRRFVFPMTAAFLVWYALYVLLSAYARGFMSNKLFGHINVALVFGLLQFVTTFLIAWYYGRYMDRRFDPLADKIRARVENGVDR